MRYIGSFQHNQNYNGVLRYFWNQSQYFYYSMVNITSTGYAYDRYPQNVIDFNVWDNWWSYRGDQPALTICLQKHFLKVTGYDIRTSTTSGCVLSKWRLIATDNIFNTALDNTNNNYNSENIVLNKQPDKMAHINWETKIPYKCFRIDSLKSSNPSQANCYDISKIELYGELFSLDSFRTCFKCVSQHKLSFLINLIVFVY